MRSARSTSRLLVGPLLLIVGAGSPACRHKAKSPPASRPAAPPRGLAAGHSDLAKAVRAVLADCKLSEGQVQACGSAAGKELLEQERLAGPAQAMRTYCRALEEKDVALRRLCAARLTRLSFPALLRRVAEPGLFECLLEGLGRVDPPARPAIARAATLMAPRLGRVDKLLKRPELVRTPEVRAAAFQALWANGRLGELPRIERLLAEEKNAGPRLALIRGFADGGPLASSERLKVCPLLRARLTAKENAMASAAATTHAAACPDEGDKLLDAAEQMAARSALDLEYLTALRAVNGFLIRKGSREQRRRTSALLAKLCRGSSLEGTLRETALDHLSAIDRPAAVRVARDLRAEVGPPPRRARSAAASGPSFPASLRDQVDVLLQKP